MFDVTGIHLYLSFLAKAFQLLLYHLTMNSAYERRLRDDVIFEIRLSWLSD